jgi:hypothetical protein
MYVLYIQYSMYQFWRALTGPGSLKMSKHRCSPAMGTGNLHRRYTGNFALTKLGRSDPANKAVDCW